MKININKEKKEDFIKSSEVLQQEEIEQDIKIHEPTIEKWIMEFGVYPSGDRFHIKTYLLGREIKSKKKQETKLHMFNEDEEEVKDIDL